MTDSPTGGSTITLRAPEVRDRDGLLRWRSDPENRRVLMWRSSAQTLDDTDAWISRRTQDPNGKFALVARDGEGVGFVQLARIDRVDGHAYVSLFIDPAQRNQGVATAALHLMEEQAQGLGLRKLLLEVLADDEAALRFWMGRGYSTVGRLRHHHEHGGRHHDVVVLERFLGSTRPAGETAMSDPHQPCRSAIANDTALIAAMASDTEVHTLRTRLLSLMGKYKYAYNWTWYGRPIIQLPQDVLAMQTLILDEKPDLIIETGIAHGGSLVFSASMLELLGRGQVLGVDIDIRAHNRAAIEAHPLAHRIQMIQGSSIADEVATEVRARARGAQRVMVCLDSNHTAEHVVRELALYAPLVTPGLHLIVFDTAIEDLPASDFPDRPWGPGNSPKTAVRAFLEANPHFEVDHELEQRLLFSVAPHGYLRRLR